MQVYVDSKIYEIVRLFSFSCRTKYKQTVNYKSATEIFETLHKYIYDRPVTMETWKGLEVKFLK